jgi:hypothetical protein
VTPIKNTPVAWRDVFRYAAHPEVFLDRDNLVELVRRCGEPAAAAEATAPGAVTLDDHLGALSALGDQRARAWEQRFAMAGAPAESGGAGLAAMIEREIVAQSAPMAAALGSWLQGLSAPAVFEDEAHLRILALLADDLGVGSAENSRHDAYRLLARQLGLTEAVASSRELCWSRSIDDPMFGWPALLFALSRRSDAFAPELLGIDLALRTIGLLPAWRSLAQRRPAGALAGLDLATAHTSALPPPFSPRSLSRWIVDRQAEQPEHRARILTGIAWASAGLRHWCGHLMDAVMARVDPRLAMAALVQGRAREAHIYHHDYKLEGRSLSGWFQDAQRDPLPLVDALGRSKLVRPKAPRSSALIDALVRPDGPMFRIFSDADIDVIARWVESLRPPVGEDGAPGPRAAAASARPGTEAAAPASVRTGDLEMGPVPTSIREAYYLLQGRALAPRTRAFAHDYVRRWTELAKASIGKTERSLPAQWVPGGLRTWLLDAHDQHSHEFDGRKADAPPSREEIIDQTLQLAPLTLIDGAWLQGFTDVGLASSRLGARLFQTYWDELGNGTWEINHPKIYREVLASMGIELPPTGSAEFADDPRLRPASFRLPVYWLCIGKCPVTFRPEVLGLNLAMELSGVGGSYRSAQTFLKRYGFPTTFVDIHNTIDNVSTGHSAWAADAIDAHMLLVAELGGLDAEWERVRTGYESLAPITRRDHQLDYFKRPPRTRRAPSAANPGEAPQAHARIAP